MPRYSFACQKCGIEFSIFATFEEYDRKAAKKFRCPKCGSRKTNQLASSVFLTQSSKSDKRIRCGCGSCGT